jgi:hypothetical protein
MFFETQTDVSLYYINISTNDKLIRIQKKMKAKNNIPLTLFNLELLIFNTNLPQPNQYIRIN